jgi:hypothetical protein
VRDHHITVLLGRDIAASKSFHSKSLDYASPAMEEVISGRILLRPSRKARKDALLKNLRRLLTSLAYS